MNRSTKAALLSALVLPGAGHFYLKKTLIGFVLACLSLLCLYFIISNAVEMALQILHQIESGEVPPDIAVISSLVSEQSAYSKNKTLDYLWPALIIIWIVGIVDAYRQGRQQSKTTMRH